MRVDEQRTADAYRRGLWVRETLADALRDAVSADSEERLGRGRQDRARTIVGAAEVKERPERRRAFTSKCASFLHQGVSLVVIDN